MQHLRNTLPMAAAAFLLATAVAGLVSPSISLACNSQSFSTPTKFANCTDLPSLNASLHWTFEPAATPGPTLSIAFTARPAAPDGWIAWGLNPAGSGMLGAQSLIASVARGSSVVVNTYNISSYDAIERSEIEFAVLEKRGEFSGGEMRIFAKLVLPPETGAEVNHVWQVGAAVRNGVPVKHELAEENLMSKSKLWLGGTTAAERDNGAAAAGWEGGGSRRVWVSGVGLYGVLLVVAAVLLLDF